jgi:CRISPR/Cas system CSM-associated protein Csm4 (group 5 of RAMP superfamily)
MFGMYKEVKRLENENEQLKEKIKKLEYANIEAEKTITRKQEDFQRQERETKHLMTLLDKQMELEKKKAIEETRINMQKTNEAYRADLREFYNNKADALTKKYENIIDMLSKRLPSIQVSELVGKVKK